MEDALVTLRRWIARSQRMVFFGGAGVSTESGIPDFRGAGGRYSQEYGEPAEVMLSRPYFFTHTEQFYEFYRRKVLAPDAKPNPAHVKLAQWEADGRLLAVITQNIDGLHQAAGSRNVLELHGSAARNHCIKCAAPYGLSDIMSAQGAPRCRCGGIIKPDVVLYGEPLDDGVFRAAVTALDRADLLLVAGTSLSVYPAAGLIDAYHGGHIALINRTPTDRDHMADLIIRGSVGAVLAGIDSQQAGD